MNLRMSIVACLSLAAGFVLSGLVPMSSAQNRPIASDSPAVRYQLWVDSGTRLLLDTRTGQTWLNQSNGGKWQPIIDPPSR